MFDAQVSSHRFNGSPLSTRSMSTKNSDYESKSTIDCKICNGNFVPGGVRIKLPERVCLWCYTRSNGAAYRRYMLLWQGLEHLAQTHPTECECQGCKIYRAALPIMNKPASIQISESSPEGQEGNTINVVLS